MPIPLFLLERIKAAPVNGKHMADLFTKLAYVLDRTEQDEGAINIAYDAPTDQLQPGDLIPTLTFSLQRQKEATVPIDPSKVIDAASIEIRPMSDPDAREMPNPFLVAEAATDVEIEE